LEIRVRDVDPMIVKQIDEKAKKLKLSRQKYLKQLLENHVMIKEINSREMEYKNTLDKNSEILFMVGEQLKESTEILKILMDGEE